MNYTPSLEMMLSVVDFRSARTCCTSAGCDGAATAGVTAGMGAANAARASVRTKTAREVKRNCILSSECGG